MLCFYITTILLILGCLSTLVIGNNLTECPQYIKDIQWGNGAKGFKGSVDPKSAKACQKWCQAPGSIDYANRPCVGWSFWAEPGLWSSSTWCYLFSNEDGPLEYTAYQSIGAVSGLRLDCESDLEAVEFMSSGVGGIHQENRMGTYTKTSQLVQGFPVYKQNVKKLNKKQFVFVGPYGNWRVGPDTATFRGSALKNPKRSPTPPRTGWQYYHLGEWLKDNSIEAILKMKGCTSGEIACADGQGCIPDSYKCDGKEDCSDGSDESLTICVKSCSYDEFTCANGYQCIPDNYKCDKEEDCSDGSDESSTICKKGCGYGMFACADGRECRLDAYKCDDKEDCFDGSDESSTTCGIESCSCSEFMNYNGYGQCKKGDSDVFGGSLLCYVNLPSNCSDLSESGTDPGRWRSAEACRSNSVCSYGQFACADGYQCIPDYYKCDRDEDCRDGSDESSNICEKSCGYGKFACADGRECILASFKCDDKEDCFDGSDESSTTCGVQSCSCSEFMNYNGYGQCKKGDSDIFGGSLLCYVNLPSNCSDLSESGTDPGRWRSAEACRSNSGPVCSSGMFACADGYQCIPDYYKCNRREDCRDGSDESLNICEKSCEYGMFACADGRECIPASHKCDDEEYCFDGSDESSTTCGVQSCSCSDYMNYNGYGQCKKGDSGIFGGSLLCYVNLPSNCSDLSESGTDPGRWRSAEACRSNSGPTTVSAPAILPTTVHAMSNDEDPDDDEDNDGILD